MNTQWLAIRQLDKHLKEFRTINDKYGFPRLGWVKTLRVALGMSVEQLANRLGVKRARITQLENAEIHDAVTLRSLKDVALAMNCEFVYAMIPKKPFTLESIIKTRAEQVAAERVMRVAHSMSLEDQIVNNEQLKDQKSELAKRLVQNFNKKLW